MPPQSLLEDDFRFVWHPYTQAKTDGSPLAIARGEGAVVWDTAGNSYIDAASSWWVAALGHANPHITRALHEQASKLHQVIFAGCTHEPAARLARELTASLARSLGSDRLCRVFYSDNGSCAVEAALKMCVQYYANRGKTRNKFIALADAYHGDTIGAMSVSARGPFNSPYLPLLFDAVFIPAPRAGREAESLTALEEAIKLHGDSIAGFIYEPLIQGAGGMLIHTAAGLDALLARCREHGIFCIADEVMTGFFRTGTLFASEQLATAPDIICLSKALTGGALPLGATVATEEIFAGFWSDERGKQLLHGHSYTANPLACAVALASIEQYRSADIAAAITNITAAHERIAPTLAATAGIANVRTLGVILAMEVETQSVESGYTSSIRNALIRHGLRSGVLLRPLGNTLYILPPYCIDDEQLTAVYRCLLTAPDAAATLC